MAKFCFRVALLLLSLCTSAFGTSLGRLHCREEEYRRMLDNISSVPDINSLCIESITGIINFEPEEFKDHWNDILRFLCFICDDTCLPYLVDIVNYCLINIKPTLNLACASSGRYKCWVVPVFNNGSTIHEVCYNHETDGTCPEVCREEIIRLYSGYGCCVDNAFNTTLFGSYLLSLGVASRDLWNKCNVQTISPCPIPTVLKTPVNNLNSIPKLTTRFNQQQSVVFARSDQHRLHLMASLLLFILHCFLY